MTMTELEIGIAIPDTVDELLAMWKDDKHATLVLYGLTLSGRFKRRIRERLQEYPVQVPPMQIGASVTVHDEWVADREAKDFEIEVEQPGGEWNGKRGKLGPLNPRVRPGDLLKFSFTLYVTA